MSKSLSFVFILSSLGCEPVSATLVELAEPQAAPRARDAGTLDAESGDKLVPMEEDAEGCVVLRDQTVPEQRGDASLAGQVVGRTASTAGCLTDAGAVELLLQTSVYGRRDGELLLERGQAYSYRWPVTAVMARVRLEGGHSPCSSEPIVFREHGALNTPSSLLATCYPFVSPIDAHYVRTRGGDYFGLDQISLGAAPLELRICRAPCPPGTMHDFDAGVTAPMP